MTLAKVCRPLLVVLLLTTFGIGTSSDPADALFGNLNPITNCEVARNYLASTGVLGGGAGVWGVWEVAQANGAGVVYHNCRVITLTWGGWFAEFTIFDRDAVIPGGNNGWAIGEIPFYPTSQGNRPELPGTAWRCDGANVIPIPGFGCNAHG